MGWKKALGMVYAGIALLSPNTGLSQNAESVPKDTGETVDVRVDTSHSHRLNDSEKNVTKRSFTKTEERLDKIGIEVDVVKENADIVMDYVTVHETVNWLIEDYGYRFKKGLYEKLGKEHADKGYAKKNIRRGITYLQESLNIIGHSKENREGLLNFVTNEGQYIPPDTVYVNVPNNIASFMKKENSSELLEEVVKNEELIQDISDTEMHEIGHRGGLLHYEHIDSKVEECVGPKNNSMDNRDSSEKTFNPEQKRLLREAFTDESHLEKAMKDISSLNDLETFYKNNVDIEEYCE